MKFEIDTFVQTVWFFRTSLNEKKAIPFTSIKGGIDFLEEEFKLEFLIHHTGV